MSKIYVLIDIGCHECAVGSELVGSYDTFEKAKRALARRNKKYGGWRDGGQSIPEIFKITDPNLKEND